MVVLARSAHAVVSPAEDDVGILLNFLALCAAGSSPLQPGWQHADNLCCDAVARGEFLRRVAERPQVRRPRKEV